MTNKFKLKHWHKVAALLSIIAIFFLYDAYLRSRPFAGQSNIFIYRKPIAEYHEKNGNYPATLETIKMDNLDNSFNYVANKSQWLDKDGQRHQILIRSKGFRKKIFGPKLIMVLLDDGTVTEIPCKN